MPEGICPTYNCSKCSNKSGGLDSCGFPCQVTYITDVGVELENGTKTPVRWVFFNTNISNSFICDFIDNSDGSYTLQSEIDRNPSFIFITDINDSVMMLLKTVQLAPEYYIPKVAIFFLNLKNGNYEYIDNPTIYFSPITTPINETNDSLSYNNDDNNCGFFGNKCPSGTVCCGQKCVPVSDYNQEKCQILCPTGTINCNGKCISTNNVYSDCSCKPTFSGSDCSIVKPVCIPGGEPCPINQFCYNGNCVTSDNNHCGSTTTVCGLDQFCNNNICINSDNNNCGGQEIKCTLPNICTNNTCIQQHPPEVFGTGDGYKYTKSQAESICSKYNTKVATKQQLIDAQKNGAQWCSFGWVADDNTNAYYPSQPGTDIGCGNGDNNVQYWTPSSGLAAVNCYGNKPTGMRRFNELNDKYFQTSNCTGIYCGQSDGYGGKCPNTLITTSNINQNWTLIFANGNKHSNLQCYPQGGGNFKLIFPDGSVNLTKTTANNDIIIYNNDVPDTTGIFNHDIFTFNNDSNIYTNKRNPNIKIFPDICNSM